MYLLPLNQVIQVGIEPILRKPAYQLLYQQRTEFNANVTGTAYDEDSGSLFAVVVTRNSASSAAKLIIKAGGSQ